MSGRLSVLAAHVGGAPAPAAAGCAEEALDHVDLKECHLSNLSRAAGDGLFVDEPSVNLYDNPLEAKFPKMRYLTHNEIVQGSVVKKDSNTKRAAMAGGGKAGFIRAGACRKIFHEPSSVKAGIVTCGGLCPGLNSIIREITRMLWHGYGVREIYGFKAGYNGLSDPEHHKPMKLNTDVVRDCAMKGGSILQAGRGGFLPDVIVDKLSKTPLEWTDTPDMPFNIIFVVGGDGTQWAADVLFQVVKERKVPISVVGLPKSIDNDVLFFDRTFGFDSAVDAATKVIQNAYVEARSCNNGVGIVKLMGRDAGFICRNASLASTVCDCILIPEVDFSLQDLKDHVDRVLKRKEHMVIAVAEGAGQHLVSTGKVKEGSGQAGHVQYGDIGPFLTDTLNKHLKQPGANGRGAGRCFYIDPSYIVRSVPATANDHLYCARMAYDSVHAALRGYTGICVGSVFGFNVMVPMALIAEGKRQMNTSSTVFQAAVLSSKMPASLSGMAAESKDRPTLSMRKERGHPSMFRKEKK